MVRRLRFVLALEGTVTDSLIFVAEPEENWLRDILLELTCLEHLRLVACIRSPSARAVYQALPPSLVELHVEKHIEEHGDSTMGIEGLAGVLSVPGTRPKLLARIYHYGPSDAPGHLPGHEEALLEETCKTGPGQPIEYHRVKYRRTSKRRFFSRG